MDLEPRQWMSVVGNSLHGFSAASDNAQYVNFAHSVRRFSTPEITISWLFSEFLDRMGFVISTANIQSQRAEPDLRVELYLLQASVLFVLLIGCFNIANLLLARSNARQGEMAVQIALGAQRAIIVRQLLIESILVTWLGAVLGLAFARCALDIINRFAAYLLPEALPFAIDSRVIGFTALISTLAALLIGSFPILHTLRSKPFASMQKQGLRASPGRNVRAMSGTLVVIQTAITLILLAGAGLLIRNFMNVLGVDPGFNPRQLTSVRITLTPDYYRYNRNQRFQQTLMSALNEISGLGSVSLATATPFQTSLPIAGFALRNYTLPKGAAEPRARLLFVTPSYLNTMQIPLIEGRWINETDSNPNRPVLVVDKNFARHYFPMRSAVGERITFGDPAQEKVWPEIVGVVGNVFHSGVEDDVDTSYFYFPLQLTNQFDAVSVLIRSPRKPSEIIALVREAVRKIDAALPVHEAGPMQDILRTSFDHRRAIMLLLECLAGIALVLSAVGIYGVLAYDVSQRKNEIGIRGAIGANGKQIVILVLWQGLWKAVLGLGIGIVGACQLSRFIAGRLFKIEATDPLTYLTVSFLLLMVAILASYLPAKRAACIDPIIALRSE